MRRPLVAGNWKMHGTRARLVQLAEAIAAAPAPNADVLLCPPAVYLESIGDAIAGSGVSLGAQNVASQPADGAFTGEIAAEMLVDAGCRYVLVGHSERRALFGENDDWVAEKFERAQQAGLTPVLCIGETLSEREAGQTEARVGTQLDVVLKRVGVGALRNAVVAYEPVWAIGTGRTATPEQAQEVHSFVRRRIADQDDIIGAELRILYGGSVKGANARDLFAMEDIDGGLVGGASLDAGEFIRIIEATG